MPDGVIFTSEFTPSTPAETHYDEAFGMQIDYWTEPVEFVRTFVTDSPGQTPSVKVNVRYMACDDITCTPPKTVELKKP